MNRISHLMVLVISILLLADVYGVTYYVAQDGRNGAFKTIMEAVRTAKAFDEIVILDKEVYKEQVTIDSTKNGLYIHSENPRDLEKPTIQYRDTKNIGPTTCAEAKDTSKITFYRNGALQILRAKWVRIEGLVIDGGGPFIFGADGIWKDNNTDCKWPLQYGNAAVTLWVAGEIIIRDCDIRNSYFGISVRDRNVGGVFSNNANQWEVYPDNGEPFASPFESGNHLIEYNRIHHNCFGLFFESAWDMGSTIRYNLIYENHHPNAIFANKVKQTSGDGGNHPGGAFFFKDNLLTPLAIYNNTFWHNFLIFAGHWNTAGVHLIFNNIFAAPFAYWGDQVNNFDMNTYQEMFGRFPYRMHNNVISAQVQRPTGNAQVQIIPNVQLPQTATEGAVVTYTGTGSSAPIIPASANLVWLEFDKGVKFLSTDPLSPDFLIPDWRDSLVQQYIVDKGWQEARIRDLDGSIADIGAISMGVGRPENVVTIKPTRPLLYQNNSVNLSFSITPRIGDMITPKMVYIRFIRELDTISNFGPECPIISENNIQTVTIPAVPPLKIGANEYTVTLEEPGKYAFFEIIVEGNDIHDEKKLTYGVGFLPYRKVSNLLVEIRDKNKKTKINELKIGEPVILYIELPKVGEGKILEGLRNVKVNLSSGFDLIDTSGKPIKYLYLQDSTKIEAEVIFTKIPQQSMGIEYVWVVGRSKEDIFVGSTEGINLLYSEKTGVVERTVKEEKNNYFLVFEKELLTLRTQKPVEFTLCIYDLKGKLCSKIKRRIAQGLYKTNMWGLLPRTLRKGVYVVTLYIDKEKVTKKVVYSKEGVKLSH